MKSEQVREITEKATEQLTAALSAGHSGVAVTCAASRMARDGPVPPRNPQENQGLTGIARVAFVRRSRCRRVALRLQKAVGWESSKESS